MSYLHKRHSMPLQHRAPIQFLQEHADAHPHKEAFVFYDEKKIRVPLTFQEYEVKSRFLAAALLEIGLVRGDRVVLMLPTSIDFVLIYMALSRIGGNTIIFEEGSHHAVDGTKDLAGVIARADSSNLHHDKVMQKIQDALGENKLKAVVMYSHSTCPLIHDKVYLYENLLQMGQTNPDCDIIVERAEALVQMDDPAFVLFSTGTTSPPKPVQFTNQVFISGALAAASSVTLDKDSIVFSDTPLDWSSGFCLDLGDVITLGMTTVFFPPRLAYKGGMLPTILKIVEEEGCTHARFALHHWHDMMECNEIHDFDLSKLKKILTGGQPTPVSVLKKVLEKLPDLTIVNMYGTTEMYLVLTEMITKDNINLPEYGALEVADGFELKIVDEEDQLVPLNTKGELCGRGALVSPYNWDIQVDHVDHSINLRNNGWHFPGDVASLDEHGKVRLYCRTKDTIKHSSLTVSPFEIENLLLGRSDVKQVCAFGVPDQQSYEKICVCIILKDGEDSKRDGHLEKEFDDWCKGNCRESSKGVLIKPHYYVFVDSFPLTRTGKISKRELRELVLKQLPVSES